jgi:hypothetical protein
MKTYRFVFDIDSPRLLHRQQKRTRNQDAMNLGVARKWQQMIANLQYFV